MIVSKEKYEDFYGFTYELTVGSTEGAILSVRFPRGALYHFKKYATERGARIAMGRISEGTTHLVRKEV